jgi:hypothetical protein
MNVGEEMRERYVLRDMFHVRIHKTNSTALYLTKQRPYTNMYEIRKFQTHTHRPTGFYSLFSQAILIQAQFSTKSWY